MLLLLLRLRLMEPNLRLRQVLEAVNELLKRRKLASINKTERLSEEDEMLETGVEVCFGAELAELLRVRVVHVCVHAEHALEDGADDAMEVGWEAVAVFLREDLLVVELALNPVHQVRNVVGR